MLDIDTQICSAKQRLQANALERRELEALLGLLGNARYAVTSDPRKEAETRADLAARGITV